MKLGIGRAIKNIKHFSYISPSPRGFKMLNSVIILLKLF